MIEFLIALAVLFGGIAWFFGWLDARYQAKLAAERKAARTEAERAHRRRTGW